MMLLVMSLIELQHYLAKFNENVKLEAESLSLNMEISACDLSVLRHRHLYCLSLLGHSSFSPYDLPSGHETS